MSDDTHLHNIARVLGCEVDGDIITKAVFDLQERYWAERRCSATVQNELIACKAELAAWKAELDGWTPQDAASTLHGNGSDQMRRELDAMAETHTKDLEQLEKAVALGRQQADAFDAAITELVEALKGLVKNPRGCSRCDGGHLIMGGQIHHPDCLFERAKAVITRYEA